MTGTIFPLLINRTRHYESPISIRDNNLIKAYNPKPEIIRWELILYIIFSNQSSRLTEMRTFICHVGASVRLQEIWRSWQELLH